MILLLLFVVQSAPAQPPSVEEIVKRAVEAMERRPERLTCRVSSERQIFDGDGDVDENERTEIEETRTRDDVEWRTVRKWKNGRDITDEARKEEDRKKREQNGKPKAKKDDDLMEPFSRKWSSHYTFQYVRSEMLWGHPTYVLRVTSHQRKEKAGNGLVWIDANDFIELKGEFVPAKLPDNADWARFQVQYLMHPSGVPVPSLLKFEGAGHKWIIKKGFRQVIRWQGCR